MDWHIINVILEKLVSSLNSISGPKKNVYIVSEIAADTLVAYFVEPPNSLSEKLFLVKPIIVLLTKITNF